ncbi:hypothetical protein AB4584_07860 [Vibrio splendidus]
MSSASTFNNPDRPRITENKMALSSKVSLSSKVPLSSDLLLPSNLPLPTKERIETLNE